MSFIYKDGQFVAVELSAEIPPTSINDIYVPKNNGIEIKAFSQCFQRRLQAVIKQQNTTRPILTELLETLKNLAAKYDTDEEDDNDSAISLNTETTSEQDISPQKYLVVDDERTPVKRPRLDEHEFPKVIWWEQRPWVAIGPNGTMVCALNFERMQWNTVAIATRCLLTEVFSEYEMATHSLSGKPSPAFHGRARPAKMQLDPLKVADIIYCVKIKTGGKERDVRATITTKCADSAKLHRKRFEKQATPPVNF